MIESISLEERREISTALQNYHSVFYTFWKICAPVYDDSISTACVGLNKKGQCLCFKINKEFWATLTDVQKCFIICHEMYHLLLNHGQRIDGKCTTPKNMTLDIPINEGLVKNFGFKRSEIDPDNNLCWIDTVFPDDPTVQKNRSFEYYYQLLKKSGRIKYKLIFNDHSDMANGEDLEDILDELADELDDEAKKSIKEILEKEDNALKKDAKENKEADENEQKSSSKKAGKGHGSVSKRFARIIIKPKPKWETIVQNWARRFLYKDYEIEQWARKSRRNSLLDSSLFLPNIIEDEDRRNEKDKVEIWAVMDYSGSCVGEAGRFFKAFDSFPKHFKTRLFCFDTLCCEVDKTQRQLVGGGGTTFSCIENKVQEEIKSNKKAKYPFLFIFTDGYASKFSPEKPKNWTFLLTEPYTHCIPPESKHYNLRDFE